MAMKLVEAFSLDQNLFRSWVSYSSYPWRKTIKRSFSRAGAKGKNSDGGTTGLKPVKVYLLVF